MRKIEGVILFLIAFCCAVSCSNTNDAPLLSALGTVNETTILLDTDTLNVRPQEGVLNSFTKGDRVVVYFISEEISFADSIDKRKTYNITVDRINAVDTYEIETISTPNPDNLPFAAITKNWLVFDYLNFDFSYFMVDTLNQFKLIRNTTNAKTSDTVNLEFMHIPSEIDSTNVTNRKLISFKLNKSELIPRGKDSVVLVVKQSTFRTISDSVATVKSNVFIYKPLR